jgi:cytoskeletal protein RodZ
MMRYVAVAALVACLGLSGALWWQSGTVSDLEAENSRLTRNVTALTMQADQSRLAADVAAARAARATQMTVDANAAIEAIRNLQLGECADAQIDPDLAAILGRRDVPAED